MKLFNGAKALYRRGQYVLAEFGPAPEFVVWLIDAYQPSPEGYHVSHGRYFDTLEEAKAYLQEVGGGCICS